MSIRSLIRAALAGIASLVLVPVEIVVAGVRQVMHMLVPRRNEASLDLADELIGEEAPVVSLEAVAAAREARRAAFQTRRSEPERVRLAARELAAGREVSRALFDPKVPEEKEVLEWLRGLGDLHYSFLSCATDERIEAHLRGERYLTIPLLPADELRATEEKEGKRMPSELEWVQILINRRVESGDEPDGDAMDDLLIEARQLAETRAMVGDHLPRRAGVSEDSRCGEDA